MEHREEEAENRSESSGPADRELGVLIMVLWAGGVFAHTVVLMWHSSVEMSGGAPQGPGARWGCELLHVLVFEP